MKKLLQSIVVLTVVLFTFLAPLSINIHQQNSSHIDNSYAVDITISEVEAQIIARDTTTWSLENALISFWKLLIFDFTQILVGFSGWFMDFFLQHSIDSNSYRTGIIEAGWEIVRNLVNIVFIFALLLIAYEKVLGYSKGNPNKRLIKTILMALVVNFSLFLSYVVIDTSNILTTTVYNQIEVVDGKANDTEQLSWANKLFVTSDVKPISVAITSKFNPQRLATFQSADGTPLTGTQKFFLYTVAGLLNILLIMIFLSVSFVFLTRTISLIFLCILAPLAFATIALPGMADKNYIGFNKWQKQLLNLSFTAPVFVFFLYLIVVFATSESFMGSVAFNQDSGHFLTTVLQVFLPFAMIATLLKTAETVTKSMVIGIGEKISGMVSKTVGTATGVAAQAGLAAATGGASFAMTAGKGLAAGKGAKAALKAGASKGGRVALNKRFNISNIPGFEGAKSFGSVRDVQLQAAKKRADITYGSDRKEMEYQDGRKKLRNQTEQWQNGVNDQKDKKEIHKKKEDLMEETNPRTGESYKETLLKALENHSKGQVVEQNQVATYNLGGNTVNMDVKDSSGKDISRIDFENKVIKKQEQDKKKYQEAVKDKRATGSAAEVQQAQTALADHEKMMEEFKKQTLESQKEMAKKEEGKITSRAKEEIAKKREDEKEPGRASRIRTGKIKVEDTKLEDDKK